MKRALIRLIVLIVLIVALISAFALYRAERRERIRVEQNQTTLLKDSEYWRVSGEMNSAIIEDLKLREREFNQSSDARVVAMKKEIDRLNLKLKQVESITNVVTNTSTSFEGVTHDTILIIKNDSIRAKVFRVRTQFNDVTVQYYPTNDSIDVDVITRDEMTQVVYKEKRGFKFWKREFYQSRDIKQSIHFANPNTKIEYPTTIKIERRRNK